MPITVLVADDSRVLRKAIQALLESAPEIQIIGEATDFAQAIEMAHDLKPDVALLDLHMPGENNVALSNIRSSFANGARLLAMSFANGEDANALAASCGAVAFLDKSNLGTELIPAIKQLAPA